MTDDLLDPDSPFMKGYTREPENDDRLINAVRACLYAHPTQRLTQIILNALRLSSPRSDGGFDTTDLWNVYDETLIDALEAYARG